MNLGLYMIQHAVHWLYASGTACLFLTKPAYADQLFVDHETCSISTLIYYFRVRQRQRPMESYSVSHK